MDVYSTVRGRLTEPNDFCSHRIWNFENQALFKRDVIPVQTIQLRD